MSATEMSHIDLEQGNQRCSITDSDTSTEDSISFSDADEGSCYAMFFSSGGGSFNEYMFDYVFDHLSISQRASTSSMSDCSVVIQNYGNPKVDLGKVERDCRICHLSLECSSDHECGIAIELGCSCKNDLAGAHTHCAERWFKIKGNMICEICNSVARNVGVLGVEVMPVEQQSNESNNVTTSVVVSSPAPPLVNQSFWQGQRLLNLMLACMVLAFVISWFLHFHLPS